MNLIRKTWQIWIVFASFFIGLGVVQIDFIKIVIPHFLTGYVVIGFLLIGILICLFLVMRDNLRLAKQLEEMQETQKRDSDAGPTLTIEGIPVQGLATHVAKRMISEPRNPVYLDCLQLSVVVHQSQSKIKDATLTWRFKGKNVSDKIIPGFRMSIAGDNFIPFCDLKCSTFDLKFDKKRERAIVPKLEGHDLNQKDLLLPFQAPGIVPYDSFDIELVYTWPNMVNPKKDYWFVEPIVYAIEIKELYFSFEYQGINVTGVSIFEMLVKDKKANFIGTLPFEKDKDKTFFDYRVESAEKGRFYIILVEGI